MDSLNGRKVLKVQLHEATHATNVGSVPTTIDSSLGGIGGATELTLVEQGVRVVGKKAGLKFDFILPSAACKIIQLVPENEKNS